MSCARPIAFATTAAFAIATAACASVPRAELAAASPRARAAMEAATQPGSELEPGRYVVRTSVSRLDVIAHAAGVGSQRLHFDRWRAWVVIGQEIKVVADLDVRTLRAPLAVSERIAKHEMLEADAYPRATFVGLVHLRGNKLADVRPGQRDLEVDVAGTASIHGRVREVKFVGRLTREEEDGWVFRARFKMARGPFDVRMRSGWDRFIDEDVTVEMDLHAHKEHVTAEPAEQAVAAEPAATPPDSTTPSADTAPAPFGGGATEPVP